MRVGGERQREPERRGKKERKEGREHENGCPCILICFKLLMSDMVKHMV